MGLILDSTVAITAERQGWTVHDLIGRVVAKCGSAEAALSAVGAVELLHGIWRAKDPQLQARRIEFVERLLAAVPVEPLTLRTARIAAKIDGESKSRGVTIPFADVLIGSTALDLGYAVVTANLRHFRMIPGLNVIDL